LSHLDNLILCPAHNIDKTQGKQKKKKNAPSWFLLGASDDVQTKVNPWRIYIFQWNTSNLISFFFEKMEKGMSPVRQNLSTPPMLPQHSRSQA
jgi:hypothetical protein